MSEQYKNAENHSDKYFLILIVTILNCRSGSLPDTTIVSQGNATPTGLPG
jgi:hypothetical protein